MSGECDGCGAVGGECYCLPVVDTSCDCSRCVTNTSAMYDVPGGCSNCGAQFTVRSRKGDKAPLSVECPACEVTVYGWRAALKESQP